MSGVGVPIVESGQYGHLLGVDDYVSVVCLHDGIGLAYIDYPVVFNGNGSVGQFEVDNGVITRLDSDALLENPGATSAGFISGGGLRTRPGR